MDIKLIKQIGQGAYGTVYLCEYNKQQAIAKKEKINPNVGISETKYYNQITFDSIARRYPDRFLKLLFSGIINDCEFTQPVPKNIKHWDPYFRKDWYETQKSDICSVLIYTPVLTIKYYDLLKRLTKTMKINELYNLKLEIFKYLLTSVRIINKAGYYHRDIHQSNIMYGGNLNKIDPTKFYLIDYGECYHDYFASSERGQMPFICDELSLFWSMSDNPVAEYMHKNKVKFTPYDDSVMLLMKNKSYPLLKKHLPSIVQENMYIIKGRAGLGILHAICLLVDYKIYCEAIGGIEIFNNLKLEKWKHPHAAYYLTVFKKLKVKINKNY